MNYEKAVRAFADYMDASLCVNGDADKKAQEALQYLEAHKWIPVMDGDGQMP